MSPKTVIWSEDPTGFFSFAIFFLKFMHNFIVAMLLLMWMTKKQQHIIIIIMTFTYRPTYKFCFNLWSAWMTMYQQPKCCTLPATTTPTIATEHLAVKTQWKMSGTELIHDHNQYILVVLWSYSIYCMCYCLCYSIWNSTQGSSKGTKNRYWWWL